MMSQSNRTKVGFLVVAMMAIAVAVPLPSLAQTESAPSLFNVVTIEVHHDMALEFERLQKELNAALKKSGVTERRISQTVRGPSAEYHIVSPVSSWAELDGPSSAVEAMGEVANASWIAQVTKCVKSRRVDTVRMREDLSVPMKAGRTPKLAVLTTRVNLPGRAGDYNDWLTDKWAPAVKAAGMDGYFVYRNAFGGRSREWISVSLVDDWGAFDSEHPVRAHLGQDGWRELTSGSGAMTESPERKIIRFRPDLSIYPEASGSTSDGQ